MTLPSLPKLPKLPDSLTRDQAIRALRAHLRALTDEENSVCQVAGQHGIFCGGFRVLSDADFKKRYDMLVSRRPGLTRKELEYLANQWQLARQIVEDVSFSCDTQAKEHDTCNGWDDFTNDDLSRFCKELFGAEVTVVPSTPAGG